MTYTRLNRMKICQLNELHRETIKRFLVQKQKEYDDEKYPIKDKDDRIRCQICNGCYVRKQRSCHYKTKKHCNKVKQICDRFNLEDAI